MSVKAAIFFLVILAAGLGVLYDMRVTPELPLSIEEKRIVLVNRYAPDFAFTTLDGEERTLSYFKGKIILVNFWASWCTPCLQEFPAMVKLVKEFDGDVILLAISKDDNLDGIENFLSRFQQLPETVKIVWDQNKKISEGLFHTVRLPETIIISPDFTMRHKITGNPEIWKSANIYDTIKALRRQ